MKKGIKKAITSPTKETVITDHKRPIHGFCYTHFNMEDEKLSNLEQQILNTLPAGRKQAITLNKLAYLLHINKKRVSVIVADLRKRGYLIGSNRQAHGGMYLIVTSNEFWETVNTLQKSVNSQQTIINALLKHEERFTRE
ncbi:MarR family transcriptional regulator [Leuconostoc falkenbergense]|uniref:MarR family transcriptional regulator n=1 Tax=Leuconostoc falkenbergense TaxID=2766470 RepID=A0ABT7RWN7_9LACO|nr:MarR family transcriptional regulator [Leuconostoc falkenbergense]MDM7645720.1 MarR family transcriptional regulator [Leuconostoc falkenbergense]